MRASASPGGLEDHRPVVVVHGDVEVDDHRHVVARAVALAFLPHDLGTGHQVGEVLRSQDKSIRMPSLRGNRSCW